MKKENYDFESVRIFAGRLFPYYYNTKLLFMLVFIPFLQVIKLG